MFVYICPKTLDSIHQKLVNNGVVKKSVSKQKVLESPLNRLVKNSCLKSTKTSKNIDQDPNINVAIHENPNPVNF